MFPAFLFEAKDSLPAHPRVRVRVAVVSATAEALTQFDTFCGCIQAQEVSAGIMSCYSKADTMIRVLTVAGYIGSKPWVHCTRLSLSASKDGGCKMVKAGEVKITFVRHCQTISKSFRIYPLRRFIIVCEAGTRVNP